MGCSSRSGWKSDKASRVLLSPMRARLQSCHLARGDNRLFQSAFGSKPYQHLQHPTLYRSFRAVRRRELLDQPRDRVCPRRCLPVRGLPGGAPSRQDYGPEDHFHRWVVLDGSKSACSGNLRGPQRVPEHNNLYLDVPNLLLGDTRILFLVLRRCSCLRHW